jgi:hypothetical protein
VAEDRRRASEATVMPPQPWAGVELADVEEAEEERQGRVRKKSDAGSPWSA